MNNPIAYVNPKDLTENTYYSALRQVQNAECNLGQDIVSFTALLDWEEKVNHYTWYYNKVAESGR